MSNSFKMVGHQSALLAHRCRQHLSETALYIKGLTLFHEVIARPCQLVRQRFDGHCIVSSGLLPLMEAPGLLVVAPREVGRFDKRPGQVLVAVAGVACTFLL